MFTNTQKVSVVVSTLLFPVLALAVWQPPTNIPPRNNTPPPINVGPIGQTKNGDLTVEILHSDTLILMPGGVLQFGRAPSQYLTSNTASSLDFFSNNARNSQLRLFDRQDRFRGGIFGLENSSTGANLFGLVDNNTALPIPIVNPVSGTITNHWILRHATNNFTEFRVANNRIMTLFSNGNVRIGSNGSDPGVALGVTGDIYASGSLCDGVGNCLGALRESDPQVGILTDGYLCRANGDDDTADKIDCTSGTVDWNREVSGAPFNPSGHASGGIYGFCISPASVGGVCTGNNVGAPAECYAAHADGIKNDCKCPNGYQVFTMGQFPSAGQTAVTFSCRRR